MSKEDDTNIMKGSVTLSEEKQFIYHDAFNKGHNQIPNMVSSCVNLSMGAKAVYAFISKHVFEKGQSAFPSVHSIAFACGCYAKSVINYIDELDEKGFIIKTHRGKGRSNLYGIVDYHEIPLLRVSEMFWKISKALQKDFNGRLLPPAKEKVIKAIEGTGLRVQDLSVDEETEGFIAQAFRDAIQGDEIDVGFLAKNIKFIPSVEDSVQEETPTEKPVRSPRKRKTTLGGVDKNHYRMMTDVNTWGINQFKGYYYDLYLDHTEHPHPRNERKHKGMLERVLNVLGGDKVALKQYITTVFEIGYDNLSLEYFSSSNRIGEIQTYLVSGKKPFYMEKGKQQGSAARPQEEATTSQYKGMSRDKLNDLLGGDNA